MKKLYNPSFLFCFVCVSFILLLMNGAVNAQVSVTATVGTTGPSSYTTVNAAFTAINAGTHKGVIIITVTASTTEPATPAPLLSSASPSSYTTVKIKPSGNVTIGGSNLANRGVLEFLGADSVTIDGDDPLTPGTRNLTITRNTAAGAGMMVIRFASATATTDGASKNIVKNCILIGNRNTVGSTVLSYGIYSGTPGAVAGTATGQSFNNDTILISNNSIERCYTAIYSNGTTATSAGGSDYLTITGNDIGPVTGGTSSSLGQFGISLNNALAVTISNNTIQNITSPVGNVNTASTAGIYLGTSANVTVTNNVLKSITSSASSGGVRGITINNATAASNTLIANNMISDIWNAQAAIVADNAPIGITIEGASGGVSILYNSVYLYGAHTGNTGAGVAADMYVSTTGTNIDVRNNVLINAYDNSTTATDKSYCIYSTVANTAFSNINYNNYYVSGTPGVLGYTGSTDRTTLAAMVTGFGGNANSKNVMPPFATPTDLHLTTGAKTQLESAGTPVSSLSSDLDGQVRPGPAGSVFGGGSAPDIGADEADLKLDSLGFDSSNVDQVTGPVLPGALNANILRIRVYVSGTLGSTPALTSMKLSTAGTTSVADLVNAKVYYTGSSSTFNSSTTFGTPVTAPNGAFTVSGTQALTAGTHYFWLTYDISSSATVNNSIDAKLDSMLLAGTYKIPVNGNPAGSRTVLFPMTYVSSTSTQANTNKVAVGSATNVILGVQAVTSATGSSIDLTQLIFNANGTTDTSNIRNVKAWYTGNSATFATGTQFGTTVAMLPGGSSGLGFTMSGTQALLNGTNYFWLTYDIASTATASNVVDAECTSITVATTAQIPTVTAPAGNREIRGNYCASAATTNADEEIFNVTFGSLNNTSACTNTGGTGSSLVPVASVQRRYGNYTHLTPTDVYKGSMISYGVTTNSCSGSFYGEVLAMYVDWNLDGDFSDSMETIFTTGYTTGFANKVTSGTLNVPCFAGTGVTVLRVVYNEDFSAPACGTYSYGETEDYALNITDYASPYNYGTAVQLTGFVAPGTTDKPVLRIPLKAVGCTAGIASDFRFNTAGSTSAGDIATAKLYSTGNSAVFNTTKLLGSVSSPSGAFSFAVSDSLVLNDTTNYWLAYDVSGAAVVSHVVDARLDSVNIFGSYRLPVNGNPAGNLVINSPMTFLGSTATQSLTTKVAQGSANNQVLGVQVVTSATGAPIYVSSLDFNANGTTDTSNIRNLRVWYTGNNSTFTTTTQFGSTLGTLPASMLFGFTDNLPLANGINYFWLSYDITPTATITNVVDAEYLSGTINTVTQYPTTSAPAGAREIRANYCQSIPSDPADEEIFNVTFGSLNNNSTCATTGGTGSAIMPFPSVLNRYANYTHLAATNVAKGSTVAYSIKTNTCGSFFGEVIAMYVDWNADGDFVDAGENIVTTGYTTGTANKITAGNIVIPCNAATGNTILRVVYNEDVSAAPCASYFYGETEDYVISITDNPVAYVSSTAIQQTGTVAPGTVDKPILRIPVRTNGCGTGLVTVFKFNTTGTTAVADITSAKLYATGNSAVFGTGKLLGTVYAPNGPFMFSLADTLINNDTTNYWLAYDINSAATLSNVVDARLDSAEITGNYKIPTVGSPAGNVVINAPMTFVSTTATQNVLSKVAQGSTNNQVLGVQVVTSATGSPIYITSLDFNANGTTDTSNIRNLKLWYTGNSAAFATTTAFGSTLAALPGTLGFGFSGNQALANGTNYFWLSYDITATATVSNLVDAEYVSGTVVGVTQYPTVSAPAGAREIRANYCQSAPSDPSDEEIFNVTFGTLNNNSTCSTTGGTGSSIMPFASMLNEYSNYTHLTPTNVLKGSSVAYSVKTNTCGSFFGEVLAMYMDWNADGDFSDVGENIFTTAYVTGTANKITSGNVVVPCNAATGNTVLRVVYNEDLSAPACGSYFYGETEDYIINITDNPVVYVSSTAIQQTGTVAPGTTDRAILRIPVRTNGCGTGLATAFKFNTTGSTAASDITAAKLYNTGNSATFNTNHLVSTVYSPTGQFTFTIADTVVNNDTTNYWLAYDISSSATLNNVVDARIDSAEITGAYRIPTVTSPAGNIAINSPMTYISSTTTQAVLSKVSRGAVNSQVIGIEVVTSATGSALNLTQFDLSTNGTTSLSDISNLRVWYTGTSNAFATTTQFGNTISTPGSTVSVTGTQALANGTNYFWVTYNVGLTSAVNNYIDAECNDMTIAGLTRTPTVSAPTGSRQIMADYCIPTYTNGCGFDYIDRAYTSGGNTNLSNSTNTGCNGLTNSYIFYNTQTLTVQQGRQVTLNLMAGGDVEGLGAWIDYNVDGDFADPGEFIAAFAPSMGVLQTKIFYIPLNAPVGSTRLRVRAHYNVILDSSQSCGNLDYGETEDYAVEILPAPTPVIYQWNQTGSAPFGTATNWTPARTIINLNDKLLFNGGGAITVTGVQAQTVSVMTVTNSTGINFNGPAGTLFNCSDTLNLVSGRLLPNNNLAYIVGTDSINTGTITGAGTVEGKITRWIAASTSSYTFPMGANNNSRAYTIGYTAAPVAGKLTIAYTTGAPGNTGLPVTDGSLSLVNVADAGIWTATPDATLTAGNYNLAINANAVNGVFNYAQTALLSRTATTASWQAAGFAVGTTGSNAAMVMGRTTLSNYYQTGIGGTSANPLPVTLVHLKAVNVDGNVHVSWSTASEVNLAGFEVQRSVDGTQYNDIGFIKASGNATLLTSYTMPDPKAFENNKTKLLYYRLKMQDMDGSFMYAEPVVVYESSTTSNEVNVYPNPFSGITGINIESSLRTPVEIELLDMDGRVLGTQHVDATTGSNYYELEHTGGLAAGMYFVKVMMNGDHKTIRINKAN